MQLSDQILELCTAIEVMAIQRSEVEKRISIQEPLDGHGMPVILLEYWDEYT